MAAKDEQHEDEPQPEVGQLLAVANAAPSVPAKQYKYVLHCPRPSCTKKVHIGNAII